MNLDVESLVADDGSLHQGVPYVYWAVGESEIVLDGCFTPADLQLLIGFMSPKQPDENNEAQP